MPNPTTSGTAYNVLTTMVALNNRNENAAFEYLRRLDTNIDQYTRSGGGPGQSAAIGEIPIAIGYAHDLVKLKATGAKVEITTPSEGTGFELAAMSLIAGGKQPVEARRLYDWTISSPVAMKHFVNYYFIMIQKGVESHPLALKLSEIKTVKQDMLWDGDPVNRKRLQDRWNAEIGTRR
jgi:iron(III) transport system substrate-binding protein